MPDTLAEYKIGVGNLALQQNFEITFSHLPGSDKSRLFSLLITGVEVPDIEVIYTDVYWRGRHGQMPAAIRSEGDLSLPINFDNNMELYNALYSSVNFVADVVTGTVRAWPLVSFVTSIKCLNPQLLNKRVGTWRLLDCTIKRLGSHGYSHQSQSDKVESTLELHFDNIVYDHVGGLI